MKITKNKLGNERCIKWTSTRSVGLRFFPWDDGFIGGRRLSLPRDWSRRQPISGLEMDDWPGFIHYRRPTATTTTATTTATTTTAAAATARPKQRPPSNRQQPPPLGRQRQLPRSGACQPASSSLPQSSAAQESRRRQKRLQQRPTPPQGREGQEAIGLVAHRLSSSSHPPTSLQPSATPHTSLVLPLPRPPSLSLSLNKVRLSDA